MNKYSIKEISKMFSIPASTLRYYEEIGILEDVQKESATKRVYTDDHIERLHTIFCFKGTGMTIAKIKEFFEYEKEGFERIDDILNLLTEQEKHVYEQLEQLQKDMRHVQRKVRYFGGIKEARETGKPLPHWNDFSE